MYLKNYCLPFAIIMTAASFVSCKKNSQTTVVTNAVSVKQVMTQSEDQLRVVAEIDNLTIDANIAIESSGVFSGRAQNVLGNLCNAETMTDTSGTTKKLTITYNGLNCAGNRFYQGIVVLSMPKGIRWKDSGAVLSINKQDLKITRIKDSSSITLNGTTLITNVTGGRLTELAYNGPITYSLTSNGLSILFDNGALRSWQLAQKKVFTYNNGIVMTTTGTHTENGTSDICVWGTNRFGDAFITAINGPVVVKQDCNYRVVSGEITHSRLAATIVVTCGLDINGATTGCPGTGNYYYKIVWTDNSNNIKTIILPY